MSNHQVEALARRFNALLRVTEGLVRAQQLPRSYILTNEDEASSIADLLSEAAGTAVTTAEQAEDLSRLDESDAYIGDALDASAGMDDILVIEDSTDDLWVEDADRFSESADADESAHEAHMTAIGAAEAVDEAKAAAEKAAQDAANAQHTADGKNSRRRGVSEPDPPEGGWVQGDQWVRDVMVEGVAIPTEVLVWNGTEFVRETLLTGEVFVIGEDGLVRIANGQVTAESMSADFYYGREFIGGRFEGGEFELVTSASGTTVLSDPCEVVSPWVTAFASGAAPTRTTAQKRMGTYSLVPGLKTGGGARGMKRPIPVTTFTRGGFASVWVYTHEATLASLVTVACGVNVQQKYLVRHVAGWTECILEIPAGAAVSEIAISTESAGTVYVDDVLIYRYNDAAGAAGIGRLNTGDARSYSQAANGDIAELVNGRFSHTIIDPQSPDYPMRAYAEPFDYTAGFSGRGIRMGIESNGPTGVTRIGFEKRGGTFALGTLIDGEEHARIQFSKGRTRFLGEVEFATDTSGPTDLPGSARPGFTTSVANYEIKSGIVFLTLSVSGTIPNGSAGTDVWSGLSTFLRPPSNRMGAAYMQNGYSGVAWARSNGTVAISNRNGVDLNSAQFTIIYPRP